MRSRAAWKGSYVTRACTIRAERDVEWGLSLARGEDPRAACVVLELTATSAAQLRSTSSASTSARRAFGDSAIGTVDPASRLRHASPSLDLEKLGRCSKTTLWMLRHLRPSRREAKTYVVGTRHPATTIRESCRLDRGTVRAPSRSFRGKGNTGASGPARASGSARSRCTPTDYRKPRAEVCTHGLKGGCSLAPRPSGRREVEGSTNGALSIAAVGSVPSA